MTSSEMKQENPANAKGNTQWRCMFEGHCKKNVSSKIPALEIQHNDYEG